MNVFMTEKMLAELLEVIERQIELKVELNREKRKNLVKIVEEELRDYIAIGTLSPANFPVGMMHQDDYYGLDNEELSKKLQAASLGCNWDI